MLAPLGPVYQAGTLSGNPLAMAAGIATIAYLQDHRNEIYRAAGVDYGGDGGGRCAKMRRSRGLR